MTLTFFYLLAYKEVAEIAAGQLKFRFPFSNPVDSAANRLGSLIGATGLYTTRAK